MSHHHCLTSPPLSLPCHHHHCPSPPLTPSPPLPVTTTNTIATTTTACHHYCVNSPNDAFGHHLGLWYFLFSFHFVFLFANMLPQAYSTSIITSTIPIAQTMQKHCLSYLVSFFFFLFFFFFFLIHWYTTAVRSSKKQSTTSTCDNMMTHPHNDPHTYHGPPHLPLHVPPPATSIFQHGLNNASDTSFRPIVCFLFFILFFCYY